MHEQPLNYFKFLLLKVVKNMCSVSYSNLLEKFGSQHGIESGNCVRWVTKGYCNYNEQCIFTHDQNLKGTKAKEFEEFLKFVAPLTSNAYFVYITEFS